MSGVYTMAKSGRIRKMMQYEETKEMLFRWRRWQKMRAKRSVRALVQLGVDYTLL